jgi:regulator of nucleoside diphosphate kinase
MFSPTNGELPMTRPRPIVNEIDKSRLMPHVQSVWTGAPLARLRETLEIARAVPPEHVPPDVVTMNSEVGIRYPEDEALEVYKLSYPYEDTPGGIPVLSPLGSAILGAREGERVDFMGARHWRSVIVEALMYQPERIGRFDL